VQGLSLRVTMQLLLILITLITVYATPEEDADVRDTTPYGADAQTLLTNGGSSSRTMSDSPSDSVSLHETRRTPWLLQSRSSWYVTENNISSF
jgi:hypothetical protein